MRIHTLTLYILFVLTTVLIIDAKPWCGIGVCIDVNVEDDGYEDNNENSIEDSNRGSNGDRDDYHQDEHGYDYQQNGYEHDTYERNGYDQGSYRRDGYEQEDYGRDGYEQEDYGRNGYRQHSYRRNDYEQYGQNDFVDDGHAYSFRRSPPQRPKGGRFIDTRYPERSKIVCHGCTINSFGNGDQNKNTFTLPESQLLYR